MPEDSLQLMRDALPLRHGVEDPVDVRDHDSVSSGPPVPVLRAAPPVPVPVLLAPRIAIRKVNGESRHPQENEEKDTPDGSTANPHA